MKTHLTLDPSPHRMRRGKWRPAQAPYERLGQRLDEIARREGQAAHGEQIERLGRSIFGDLWDGPATPEALEDLSTPHPTLSPVEAERASTS